MLRVNIVLVKCQIVELFPEISVLKAYMINDMRNEGSDKPVQSPFIGTVSLKKEHLPSLKIF